MTSATEWARQNGEHFRWTAALDNHEPVREYAQGDGWYYTQHGERRVVLDVGIMPRERRNRALYILDDGTRIVPMWVLAFHPEMTHVILGPFPVNVNNDGTPRLRDDDQRPVDFSNWYLGPRYAYHLKVRGDAQ